MLVPEVITDLLQRQALGQKMRGTGVAQRMRPVMRQRHTERSQTWGDHTP